MSYVGYLYYISGQGDSVTVGMVTHSRDLFSADLLDYLPAGNVVQAIAAIIDALDNGVQIPSLNFFDVAEGFPPTLSNGLILPTLGVFLTGVEDTVTLPIGEDFDLQYVTGDVVYRMAEYSHLTTSTVSICRIAYATYQRQGETPLKAPVFPADYRRQELPDGSSFYFPRAGDFQGVYKRTIADRYVYNNPNNYPLDKSKGNLDLVDVWYDGQLLPDWHVFAGVKPVSVTVTEVNGAYEYYIVAVGADSAKSFGAGLPSGVPEPYLQQWNANSEVSWAEIYELVEDEYRCEKPPYYIPPGGEPEGEFYPEGEYGHMLVAALTALALIWLMRGRK